LFHSPAVHLLSTAKISGRITALLTRSCRLVCQRKARIETGGVWENKKEWRRGKEPDVPHKVYASELIPEMFVGHYSVAFALKNDRNRIPL